jgi:hypothetical protein
MHILKSINHLAKSFGRLSDNADISFNTNVQGTDVTILLDGSKLSNADIKSLYRQQQWEVGQYIEGNRLIIKMERTINLNILEQEEEVQDDGLFESRTEGDLGGIAGESELSN